MKNKQMKLFLGLNATLKIKPDKYKQDYAFFLFKQGVESFLKDFDSSSQKEAEFGSYTGMTSMVGWSVNEEIYKKHKEFISAFKPCERVYILNQIADESQKITEASTKKMNKFIENTSKGVKNDTE